MYRVGWMFEAHNMGALMAAAAQGIELWKAAGAPDAALWALDGSAPGTFAFAVNCESAAQFYAIEDALQSNPEFMAWRLSWQNMFDFTANYRVTPVLDMSSEHLEAPAFMAQWHFIPSSMENMMEAAPEGAEIWKRHGAKMVMLTSLAGTGVGQFAWGLAFESGAAYGEVLDAVQQDEDFAAWQAKYMGTATWTGNIYGRRIL